MEKHKDENTITATITETTTSENESFQKLIFMHEQTLTTIQNK